MTLRTVTLREAFGYSRLVIAAVCVVSLVGRFIWGLGSATFTAGNFFAYLTIQSNISFVVVSVIAAVVALRGPANDPQWLTTLRSTVLTCTVSSGVVFAFLVQQAGVRGFRIDVPWSDQVLHFILPVFAIADWVLAPGRGRAQWRTIAFAIVFTIGWGIVTLIRGAFVGWYPYFFLDPGQVSGIGEFVLLCSIALALFATLSSGIIGLSRIRPVFAPHWQVRFARRKVTRAATGRGKAAAGRSQAAKS